MLSIQIYIINLSSGRQDGGVGENKHHNRRATGENRYRGRDPESNLKEGGEEARRYPHSPEIDGCDRVPGVRFRESGGAGSRQVRRFSLLRHRKHELYKPRSKKR